MDPIHLHSRNKARLGRRHHLIDQTREELAYSRIVKLPFDIATVYAATQNFRMDLAKGIHTNMTVWDVEQESYFDEALKLLQEQGCNHFPGDNGELWIHEATMAVIEQPSSRAICLSELFDILFAKNDVGILNFYAPDPRVVKDNLSIYRHFAKVACRFYHN